jgi:two-component system OmpR family response regulator
LIDALLSESLYHRWQHNDGNLPCTPPRHVLFPQEPTLHALVIEDDPITSRYIADGLHDAGFLVEICRNGHAGLAHLDRSIWDVVILDRMLEGPIDGLDVLTSMRAKGNKTPVILLSALNSTDERIRGLRSGGDDYLPKPFVFGELLARVESLLRRVESPRDITSLTVADLTLDVRTMRATRAGQVIHLQVREFRLLEYLMRHAGQVITRAMLLENVWNYHFNPQSNITDVQISRLRHKIDKGFSPALIHTVWGTGYRLAVETGNPEHPGAAA